MKKEELKSLVEEITSLEKELSESIELRVNEAKEDDEESMDEAEETCEEGCDEKEELQEATQFDKFMKGLVITENNKLKKKLVEGIEPNRRYNQLYREKSINRIKF